MNQRGKLSVDLLLGVVNTVFVLAALGTLAYTQILYKRPPITEEGERKRLAELHKKPPAKTAPGVMQFDPFTVNIRSVPTTPLPAEGTPSQIQGKTHFARAAITLELRDIEHKYKIDDVRPKILDALLTMFGNKQFNEITTVQGRYILRNEILDLVNETIKEPLVTNVFFTEFIVQ